MRKFHFALMLLSFSCILMAAGGGDTIITYYIKPVEITAKKLSGFSAGFSLSTDYSNPQFYRNGFALIRRGGLLTQDIYSDGFRRGDIKITIDGEQYHNACPMRMDAPASRINPIEVESAELIKSGSLLYSGIGGQLRFHRRQPGENQKYFGSIKANTGSHSDVDASFGADYSGHGAVIRYSTGKPYKNGDGKTFRELYGYKEDYIFTHGSIALTGKVADYTYHSSFSLSENVLFPYLQMDEKRSSVFSVSLEKDGYKLYLNSTSHLMNNSLRNSSMVMETNASNLTAGITGPMFEAIYRRWDADNFMSMMMSGMPMSMPMTIRNDLLPGINQIGTAAIYEQNLGGIDLAAKAGFSYLFLSNKERVNFYKTLYPDASEKRFFVTASLTAGYSGTLVSDIAYNVLLEGVTEAPEAEQLFIALERLSTNPNWSGNPKLKPPFKYGSRVMLSGYNVSAEGYIFVLENYVDITKVKPGTKFYQTYANIPALLAGVNCSYESKYLLTDISYVYGENRNTRTPLAEIAPFSVRNEIRLPEIYGMSVSLNHEYSAAQKRVNTNLYEQPSKAWNVLGMGINYSGGNFRTGIELNNLLNHNYSRFLSFSRNPFSSGAKVFEPGTSVQVYFRYMP